MPRKIATTNPNYALGKEKAAAIDTQELARRYLDGESENSLARVYGVDRRTIRRRLVSEGVSPRSYSAAQLAVNARRSPERRRWIASFAFEAKRGRPNSPEKLAQAALTRQARGVGISPTERELASLLADRGLATTSQEAVGPYNVDLGAFPVAVEVFGGGWHAGGHHRAMFPGRARYLLDKGWLLVVVWVHHRRYRLGVEAADYIVALAEQARRDPSLRGQYRVIRGTGEELARGHDDLDQLTRIRPLRRSQDAGSSR